MLEHSVQGLIPSPLHRLRTARRTARERQSSHHRLGSREGREQPGSPPKDNGNVPGRTTGVVHAVRRGLTASFSGEQAAVTTPGRRHAGSVRAFAGGRQFPMAPMIKKHLPPKSSTVDSFAACSRTLLFTDIARRMGHTTLSMRVMPYTSRPCRQCIERRRGLLVEPPQKAVNSWSVCGRWITSADPMPERRAIPTHPGLSTNMSGQRISVSFSCMGDELWLMRRYA